jgi:pyruvate/2-oxoglutarate dehydrogenase complex dihydrolipoamide acyltransferase (E2) component
MAQYRVRVREDWRWDRAQVAGREFTKAGEVLAEGHINEEMRRSPLLEIEEIAPDAPVAVGSDDPADVEQTTLDQAPDAPVATEAAMALAAEHGVDLREVEGTGEDGRVLVADVEAVLS